MKEVKIRIKGDLVIVDYCSQSVIDENIESRIIEGKMSEIKGDKMIEEKNAELLEQESIMDKCNYLYGQKQEMLYEGSYKKDMDHIQDDEERQKIVRRYVNKVMLEKTGDKRGHYLIEIIMTNNSIYKYLYWSSGPWNHVEKI